MADEVDSDLLIKSASKLKFYTVVESFVYLGPELTREEAKTEHEAVILRRTLTDNRVDRGT